MAADTIRGAASAARQSHEGRPIMRAKPNGGVLILCPVGHVFHSIPPGEWAGSLWEARASDPRYTVTCYGRLPLVLGL